MTPKEPWYTIGLNVGRVVFGTLVLMGVVVVLDDGARPTLPWVMVLSNVAIVTAAFHARDVIERRRVRRSLAVLKERFAELTKPRSCNLHADCAAAERQALEDGQSLTNFHCHVDDCEECYGR